MCKYFWVFFRYGAGRIYFPDFWRSLCQNFFLSSTSELASSIFGHLKRRLAVTLIPGDDGAFSRICTVVLHSYGGMA